MLLISICCIWKEICQQFYFSLRLSFFFLSLLLGIGVGLVSSNSLRQRQQASPSSNIWFLQLMDPKTKENERPSEDLEESLDHDVHHLAITAADAESVNEVSWREVPGNGWSLHFNSAEQSDSFKDRVISVKWGDKTKEIGIDGTAEAIKEAIKSSFMLRTKRPFWLEDEDSIVRPVDRYMPLRNYTLHVDEGLTIKVCMSEEPDDLPVQTEDKTFYSEDDFYDFLSRRGWTRLRENNGYRNIDRMDELCPGAVYRGVS